MDYVEKCTINNGPFLDVKGFRNAMEVSMEHKLEGVNKWLGGHRLPILRTKSTIEEVL
jgi:hypothetical protein